MKILHVIHRYWPYVGGSELYFQEISERLVREGHHVTVYTTDAWDLEHFWSKGKRRIAPTAEIHNGVPITRFPVEHLPAAPLTFPLLRHSMAQLGRLPKSAPLLFSLARWMPRVPALEQALDTAKESVDLVHVANITLESIASAAFRFAKRRRIPFVITPFTHLGASRYYTMPHQIEMLQRADAVIVQTDLELEALAARGVPRARMHRIGVGINPDQVLGGDAARFRRRYGIEGRIVFSLGAAAFDKGAVHLVQAMEKLWGRGDSGDARIASAPTLVIAGPTLTAFEKFMARRPSETRRGTRVLGFISDEDKRDLLAAGDVYAMPSRTESFGIVYLEAWLYNKPVIGARAGGVPEVIQDGIDGFLVEFGDINALSARIEQLLTDHALAERMGQAGHAQVLRELTWDQKYAQVHELYTSLIAKNA